MCFNQEEVPKRNFAHNLRIQQLVLVRIDERNGGCAPQGSRTAALKIAVEIVLLKSLDCKCILRRYITVQLPYLVLRFPVDISDHMIVPL